jgi:hypothetical protein
VPHGVFYQYTPLSKTAAHRELLKLGNAGGRLSPHKHHYTTRRNHDPGRRCKSVHQALKSTLALA